MSANLSAIFYLISGVLFILALRGLSSPETSRRGNFFGILGMVIAITVTFLSIGNFSSGFIYVLIFLLIGGSVGAFVAFKIPMTAMPELVAGFHSLVGLAAVFVAISAFLNPEAFNLGTSGNIKLGTLIEMSIGASVGAITFSGSIIAFLKLKGIMSGSPITFKGQHLLNALILISIIVLIYLLCSAQSSNLFWSLVGISFLIGFLLIIPIGGADMPVVISMLNSYSGWAAAGIGFTLENSALIITGALVGSSGAILSYIMCKGMNRSFFNVILINKNKKKYKIKNIVVPGQGKIHYSPEIPIRLNIKNPKKYEAYMLIKKRKISKKNFFYLSKKKNLKEAAKNLYKTLRIIKKNKFKSIAVEKIPNIGFGETINDRLIRASK